MIAAPAKGAAKKTVRPVTVAVNGEASGAIVIDSSADRTIQLAANELQNYLRLITTARYTVLHSAGKYKSTDFILGKVGSDVVKPFMKRHIPKQIEKIENDGYAVLRRGNKIIIAAKTSKGVLNGVHRFIHRHTDFIWVRPLKERYNCTVDPNLKLEVSDYVDNPVFSLRGWLPNAHVAYNDEFFIYCSRLGINYLPKNNVPRYQHKFEIHGMSLEFGSGHNFSRLWLPKSKYGKSNPEFYMLINGKRQLGDRVQLCYGNPEMHKAFINEVLAVVKTLPSKVSCINLMIDDVNEFCECDLCMKDIRLPDGRVLKRRDEAFKSTLFYLFFNKVAREVAKIRPDLKVATFGYFFTAIPPEIPVEKNIRIKFCPYIRNDKQTLGGKTNAKWLARTQKYAKMSSKIFWREYYFACAASHRPQANIIARDLRYIRKLGIREVAPEISWGDIPRREYRGLIEPDFFDITGVEFWTITQLFWNPYQSPEKLRREYFSRVYREAGSDVEKFYKIFYDSFFNDPSPSVFRDDYRTDVGSYIIRKNLQQPSLDALNSAASKVKNPVSRRQLEALTATFKKWLSQAEDVTISCNVPKVEVSGVPGFDFTTGVWQKAAELKPFKLVKNLKHKQTPDISAEPTQVKIMHNGKNIFVAYSARFPGKIVNISGKRNAPYDKWLVGDRGEIFISNNRNGYYQLAFSSCANGRNGIYDAAGSTDAKSTDPSWNAQWHVYTKIYDNEWRAVVVIPFSSLGVILEQNNMVRALFCRHRPQRHPKDISINTSWNGGRAHHVSSFGALVFDLE